MNVRDRISGWVFAKPKKNNKTPIVLMGYMNPIENIGYKLFAKTAKSKGVDGVLIVDLPPEEASLINKVFRHSL